MRSREYDLDQNNGGLQRVNKTRMEWKPISSAPFDRELEVAVIDRDGPHVLVFAARRIVAGWIKAETKEQIDVHPTHWREWSKST
jgi:hypothetical protein